MTYKCIIVDDEPLGIDRIRGFLKKHSEFLICSECHNGQVAIDEIRQLNPDIVFLDIKMPGIDGFGVVQGLLDMNICVPLIIFVTAFNEHAVKAFDVSAVDYLLKPVQENRFLLALQRAKQHLSNPQRSPVESQLLEILNKLRPESGSSCFQQRLEVRTSTRTEYVSVSDVLWLEADGNYVEVHTPSRTYLTRVTLSELEQQLNPSIFYRANRSVLVNMRHISAIQSNGGRGHDILTGNNHKIQLTRSLDELKSRLKFLES